MHNRMLALAGRYGMDGNQDMAEGNHEGCEPRGKKVCGLPVGVYMRAGCRIWGLPFDSGETLIVAGASRVITARPQYPFVGEVLVIPSATGPWTVNDIKIATQSQLLAEGSQHSDVYSEISQQNWLNMDFADAGIEVKLDVTNISGVAQGRVDRFLVLHRVAVEHSPRQTDLSWLR